MDKQFGRDPNTVPQTVEEFNQLVPSGTKVFYRGNGAGLTEGNIAGKASDIPGVGPVTWIRGVRGPVPLSRIVSVG